MRGGEKVAVDYIDNNSFVQSIIDKGKAERETRNTGELGKEEFLKLLILQLRYQDPLNPVEDKEFIAQMAQFSALEQMQNMNASFSSVKGFSMIGKYVYGTVYEEATGINRIAEGHVESVKMFGGRTYVVVDGIEVPIENVYNVADGFNPLSSSIASYTNLIGHNVYGAVYDITTGEIVGVEGDVVSLAKGLYEDYAILNNVNVTVSGANRSGVNDTERNRLIDYLEGIDAEEDPAKRTVEIFITDANGKQVPVSASLKSFKIEADGSVTAVLDNLAIPVTSVSRIKQAGQTSGAQLPGNSLGTEGAEPDGGLGAEAVTSDDGLGAEAVTKDDALDAEATEPIDGVDTENEGYEDGEDML